MKGSGRSLASIHDCGQGLIKLVSNLAQKLWSWALFLPGGISVRVLKGVSQRTTYRTQLSPPFMWVSERELRLLDLALLCADTSPVLELLLKNHSERGWRCNLVVVCIAWIYTPYRIIQRNFKIEDAQLSGCPSDQPFTQHSARTFIPFSCPLESSGTSLSRVCCGCPCLISPSLRSRGRWLAWSTQRVLEHPGIHRKSLS